MKRLFIGLTIYFSMMCAIVAAEFMGNEYAENIAVFVAWFFILTGFIGLVADPEDIFGKLKYYTISKTAQYAMISMMITVGWSWTGFFYLLMAGSMHLKFVIYKDSLKETSEEVNMRPNNDG